MFAALTDLIERPAGSKNSTNNNFGWKGPQDPSSDSSLRTPDSGLESSKLFLDDSLSDVDPDPPDLTPESGTS